MREKDSKALKFISLVFLGVVLFITVLVVLLQVLLSRGFVDKLTQDLLAKHSQQLEENKLKMSFDKVTLTANGSFRYPFGLRIKKLQLKWFTECHKVVAEFDTTVVPIHFRKALNKELDLGVSRFYDGKVIYSHSCIKAKAVSSKKRITRFLNREQAAIDRVKIFKEALFSELNIKDQKPINFKGLTFYKTSYNHDSKFLMDINKIRILLGAGGVPLQGEWESSLRFNEDKMNFKGSFKGYPDRLETEFGFFDKESQAKILAKAYKENSDKVVDINLGIKSFSLSTLSKLQDIDFLGFNKRRTWVDLNAEVSVRDNELGVQAFDFKAYGDFGKIDLVSGFKLLWKNKVWSLEDKFKVTLSDIRGEEVLSSLVNQKASTAFTALGRANAVFNVESLHKISGEFEIRDSEFLLKSLDKKTTQKIPYIKGRVDSDFKKEVLLQIEEIQLGQGEFDGKLAFKYLINKKWVQGDFEIAKILVSKERLAWVYGVRSDLLVTDFDAKSRYPIGGQDFTSEIEFKIKEFIRDQWAFSNIAYQCSTAEKKLLCKGKAREFSVEEGLAKKLNLKNLKYENVTVAFEFTKRDKLELALNQGKELKLIFNWTKETGLSVKNALMPETQEVYLRSSLK